MVYENGTLLAESRRFADATRSSTFADVDLDRLDADRMRQNTFGESARRHAQGGVFGRLNFPFRVPGGKLASRSEKSRHFPTCPATRRTRDARCEEVYRIQVQGLVTRMRATGTKKLVIGVSGGLDSTQALLVCARAMDELGLPRANILAYTMPGFATSTRTRSSAWQLMRAIGASAEEIDIRPSCMQMLKDLGHPYAKGRKVYDITFENVQAGERTSHLFRLANQHGGLVVGTGDLSELGARLGDLWRRRPYVALQRQRQRAEDADPAPDRLGGGVGPVRRGDVKRSLQRVLATEISPELVPGSAENRETAIGPYELQDFNLYYTLRFGYAPSKVAFLAWHAWQDKYRLARDPQVAGRVPRASSRPASSSGARCRTRPRSARAARSRRAATGARLPTATPPPGWRT